MTRKNRNLVVSLALLLLALVALLVVKTVGKNRKEDAPAAVQRPESLTDIETVNLRRVHLENPSGVLDITSADGETWLLSDTPEYFRSLPGQLERTVQTLASIRPMEIIAEEIAETDLEPYGLDSPRAIVTLKTKDGETITVEFGDQSPSGSGRYARIPASPTITIVPSYISNSAFSSVDGFRDMSLPQVDVQSITAMELRNNGRVFKSEPGTEKHPFVTMASDSVVVSPWRGVYPIDDYKLTKLLTEESPLPGSVAAYRDELSPENPELGLRDEDNPDRIYLEDKDGGVLDLIIGASDGNGHRYARLGDRDDAVFLLNEKDIGFLSTDPFTLTNKFLFLASISSVSQIKIADGRQQFLMERIERGDAEDTRDDLFKINSLEVPQKEFSAAYQKLIGVMWEGVATEDVPLERSEVQITLSHVDPNVAPAVLRFWNYNDVYYLAAVDGNPLEFLVGRYQVKDLIEDIAALSEYAS